MPIAKMTLYQRGKGLNEKTSGRGAQIKGPASANAPPAGKNSSRDASDARTTCSLDMGLPNFGKTVRGWQGLAAGVCFMTKPIPTIIDDDASRRLVVSRCQSLSLVVMGC